MFAFLWLLMAALSLVGAVLWERSLIAVVPVAILGLRLETMMNKARKNENRGFRGVQDVKGFSLMSLMMAMVILSVGLMAAVSASLVTTGTLVDARLHSTAISVAESYMEDVVERGVTESEAAVVVNSGLFSRSLSIEAIDSVRTRLIVTVQYNRSRGRAGLVRLVTVGS